MAIRQVKQRAMQTSSHRRLAKARLRGCVPMKINLISRWPCNLWWKPLHSPPR